MLSDDELKAQALERLVDVATLHGGWAAAIDALEALIQVDADLQRMGEPVH